MTRVPVPSVRGILLRVRANIARLWIGHPYEAFIACDSVAWSMVLLFDPAPPAGPHRFMQDVLPLEAWAALAAAVWIVILLANQRLCRRFCLRHAMWIAGFFYSTVALMFLLSGVSTTGWITYALIAVFCYWTILRRRWLDHV